MQRVAFLDGARGWACASVVVHHSLFHGHGRELNDRAWFEVLVANNDGIAAVEMFWAISGFALACAADEKKVVFSALARLPRLYLPVLFAVLLFCAVDARSEDTVLDALLRFASRPLLVWNTLFEVRAMDRDPALSTNFGQLWTLRAEVQGSYLIYLLTFLVHRTSRPKTVLALATACAARASAPLALFAAGMAVRTAHAEVFPRYANKLAMSAVAPAALAFHLSVNFLTLHGRKLPLCEDWLILARAAGLLCAMSCSARVRRCLESRPSLFLGRHSYPVYICHFAFVQQLRRVKAISHPMAFLCVVSACSYGLSVAVLARVDAACVAASKMFASYFELRDVEAAAATCVPDPGEEVALLQVFDDKNETDVEI